MKTKLLLGTALAVIAGAVLIDDAVAATATGHASAIIRKAITLAETSAMDFATVTADPAGDNITVSPAGTIAATGSSVLTGTPAAGKFTTTGTPGSAVNISFSTGNTLTGPGTAMPLNNFTHNAGASPAFNTSGALNFDVGARLVVNSNQLSGNYSGTYSVTVDYQ